VCPLPYRVLSIRPGMSDATTAEIGLWVEIATATSTGASRGIGIWCWCGGTGAGGEFTTDQTRYVRRTREVTYIRWTRRGTCETKLNGSYLYITRRGCEQRGGCDGMEEIAICFAGLGEKRQLGYFEVGVPAASAVENDSLLHTRPAWLCIPSPLCLKLALNLCLV